MYDPNSPETALGDESQSRADKILLQAGYHILPSHKCGEGKAAMILGAGGKWIAMDTLDIRGGKAALRDTKGKTQSTYRRLKFRDIHGNWRQPEEQHGIDARNYDHYKQQCDEAGIVGHIAVVELNREVRPFEVVPGGRLLVYDLGSICRREDEAFASYGKGGMVYWSRDDYIEEYDLETGAILGERV